MAGAAEPSAGAIADTLARGTAAALTLLRLPVFGTEVTVPLALRAAGEPGGALGRRSGEAGDTPAVDAAAVLTFLAGLAAAPGRLGFRVLGEPGAPSAAVAAPLGRRTGLLPPLARLMLGLRSGEGGASLAEALLVLLLLTGLPGFSSCTAPQVTN